MLRYAALDAWIVLQLWKLLRDNGVLNMKLADIKPIEKRVGVKVNVRTSMTSASCAEGEVIAQVDPSPTYRGLRKFISVSSFKLNRV